MTTYTKEELDVILKKHQLWVLGDPNGVRANLKWASLSGAYLKGADLVRANLEEAYLYGANLEGANFYGANLKWANLYGANLLAWGDMKYLKTLQFDKWAIGYTHDVLQVGCQSHPIEKWQKWNTEAGRKWISQMDEEALDWADKYLDLVLTLIEKNPAKGGADD